MYLLLLLLLMPLPYFSHNALVASEGDQESQGMKSGTTFWFVASSSREEPALNIFAGGAALIYGSQKQQRSIERQP